MKEFLVVENENFEKEKYKNEIVYSISYPNYDSKSKIAIIKCESLVIAKKECVPNTKVYLYLRENNSWKSLKKYGTENIYITLEKYKRKKAYNN